MYSHLQMRKLECGKLSSILNSYIDLSPRKRRNADNRILCVPPPDWIKREFFPSGLRPNQLERVII